MGSALAAAAVAALVVPFAADDSTIRMSELAAAPASPQAGAPLVVTARIVFEGTPGSIRCSARAGGLKVRTVRLTWESTIARCSLIVPRGAAGKSLTVTLRAQSGGNRARQTLGFRVA
jgi:hypothetical protein